MSFKHFLLKRYRGQLSRLSHPSQNPSFLPKLLELLGLKIAKQNLEHWTQQSVCISSQKCLGEIDYAYQKNNKLIVRGWIFNTEQDIEKLELIIRGLAYRVILKTEPRPDVLKAFPAEKNAFKCGFYLVIPWQDRQLLRCSPKFIVDLQSEVVTGHFRSIDIEKLHASG